jgi:hypothetical protein
MKSNPKKSTASYLYCHIVFLQLENNLKVFHGPDLKDEKNCVTINQYYKAEKTGKKFDALTFKNKCTFF